MKEQKKQITLRIPEELCDYCTKIAKERQWRRSDVISDYIKNGDRTRKRIHKRSIHKRRNRRVFRKT